MKRLVIILILCCSIFAAAFPFAAVAPSDSAKAPRPIGLADILAWKRIQSPVVSNNGKWFAYRLAPIEGDGEIVIKNCVSMKELRLPAGETDASPEGPSVSFSEDSKWLAYVIYPSSKEAKRLKKDKKPLYNKLGLVDLTKEKKVAFDKVKSYAFSGEASNWLVLQKYPGESPEKEKSIGSDLILHDLSTAAQLNVGNVSEFAFDKKGRWLAWIVDAKEKAGNGIEVRVMETGVVLVLDSDTSNYKGLSWTEKGDGLAVLKGTDDTTYEDKLHSVLGFTDLSSSHNTKVLYDPRRDTCFPSGMTISPNRKPEWSEDLSAILFGIHEPKKKEGKGDKKGPGSDTIKKVDDGEKEKPDLVIWHYKDSRLQSQQQVEESRDKDFSYLCTYRVREKAFFRLADDSVRRVTAAPKQAWAVGMSNREYELRGSLDGRRYQDLYAISLKDGSRRLAVKKNRWYFGSSPDGTHFLYYDDGHFYTYDMASGRSYKITQDVPAVFYDQEDDHNVVKPPTHVVGWVKDGESVLISDGWDIWNIPVHGGQGKNLTVNWKREAIRLATRFRLDPDEKGIDLSQPVYFSAYGEQTKKMGIGLIDKGRPGPKMLMWEDAAFNHLLKSKSAERYFYTRETYKDFPDYYGSDHALQGAVKLTQANPQQKEFLWSSGSKLINYRSVKGDTLQGALFLPANYDSGKNYPTIVYIYEKLSNTLNEYAMPSANGFNKSVYTSNGYAVLTPDIVYKVNDPGMSAVWCVLPALDSAIATGVVDRNRVALHGHSWGGYQTAFLITQTTAFKAAIAGAPLTNMISMYSSIYWNTGSANQPIFESSQGRFTGGYWENLDAYARNSPVYFANKVTTPLIILHNDKDGAVNWNQGIEYFNTLRRLEKPVVLLQYKGENHGLREPANRKDYTVRMREFFDHYLMDKPAPKWLLEGIPHLKMKEYLEERTGEKPKASSELER
jgi:dipeptidyl aminopeptidase/acylaminoacyl peptidase